MNEPRPPWTPWNPDPRAVAKVLDPLPCPTHCPFCGDRIGIVPNKLVFGKPLGSWPWVLICFPCRVWAGLHPYTGIPMAILADKTTREARRRAKDALNTLWLDTNDRPAGMTRRGAYAWLAFAMNIDVRKCHIGWFTKEQCEQAVALIEEHTGRSPEQLQRNLDQRVAELERQK